MTGFKYWDGTTWKTITAVPGPAGPAGANGAAGPPAVWSDPNAPPTHDYLWIDTDEPAAAVPIPRCKLYRNAALSNTGAGSYQKVPLDTTAFDDATNPMADLANGRIVVSQAGVYDITGLVGFVANANGIRGVAVYRNGVQALTGQTGTTATASGAASLPVTGTLRLNAGDYLELFAYQSSGVSLGYSVGEVASFLTVELRAADLWVVGAPPPLVTVLPVAPVDGQEVYYQNAAMATDGLVWLLRYRAAAAAPYRWEFVGGAALQGTPVGPSDANQLSTVYADFTTVGPSLTAPLAGVYDIEFEAFVGGGAATYYWITPKLGTAAPVDADAIQVYGDTGNEAGTRSRSIRRTVAAGDLVKLQYKVGGGNCNYSNRGLRLRPVRLG